MKKIFLFVILAVIAMGSFAQKGGAYHSKEYSGLTPKDGAAYLDMLQSDERSKFIYLIQNDDQNLYIDIILGDRAAIQKTMMYGLTTWIDPTGKKKKGLGIVFPVPGGGDAGGNPGMKKGRDGGKDRQDMMALAMQEKNSLMILKGFSGKGSEKEINPMSGDGIKGKFSMMEAGHMRVALVVPLDRIERSGKDAMDLPLSIGFETGYMDLNRSGMTAGAMQQDGSDHDHGPPGGGPPGGGMDSQGGKPQQANINQLASPSKMWLKQVKLAGSH